MDREQALKDKPDLKFEFDRAMRAVARQKARKRLWFWVLAIFFISILLSLFVNFIPILYNQLIHYNDPSYRPMDIERQYQELNDQRKTKGP